MIAVITGSTKGIGKAIAERFAAAGFNLVITSRTQSDLLLMKKRLEGEYLIEVLIRQADFSRKSDVLLFAEYVKKNTSVIDVLVNNVGQYYTGKILDAPADQLAEAMQINLFAAHYLTCALAPGMKSRKKGHIFNIASILAKEYREDAASYTISKHALLAWNKLLFEEMRQYNVKVTAIIPGSTFSDSWKGMKIDFSKLIQPDDVAESIYQCFNLSSQAVMEELVIQTLNKNFD